MAKDRAKINKEQLARALKIKQNKITTYYEKDEFIYYSINHNTKFKKISLNYYNEFESEINHNMDKQNANSYLIEKCEKYDGFNIYKNNIKVGILSINDLDVNKKYKQLIVED